jgi:drug/metabolite transporter (DMT)-like permease
LPEQLDLSFQNSRKPLPTVSHLWRFWASFTHFWSSKVRERFFPAIFVALWATGFIGARYAMPWCEPFLFLAVRFFLAGAILALLAFWAGAVWPSWAVAIHAAIAGALIHGVYLACVFWAIRNGLPAGMSALIVGIQPLVTALIAGPVLKEKVSPQHWLGLAIGLIGIALVLSPKLNLAGTGINAGTLTASFISVLGIAAGTIWQKCFVTGADLRTSTSLQYLGATVLTGALTLMLEKQEFVLTGELVFAMFWLVFVLSLGAIFLLMILIRDGAVSKVASLFCLVPSVTALMAWFLFGEILTVLQIVGMLVTAAGVALATRQGLTFSRASR